MSTGNTLMVGNAIRNSLTSSNGSLEPKPWWILVFIIGFIVFELIKWTFLR